MKKFLLSMAMMSSITTGFAQKTLVLYYSETGTTKTVAQELQKQLGADIESIEAEEPYTGIFQETIQRGQREMQSGNWPALKPFKKKIQQYDIIFLGYPIWFGTYANPIATLVRNNDFAGKTIVPFCTFGSGGLNTSSDALKKALPKAKIQKPVTEADKAIFDAACSNYQFPLGTPKTVGCRTTDDSIDYKFIVMSRGFDGKESPSTIYVTVGKQEGAKPEFTEVVR